MADKLIQILMEETFESVEDKDFEDLGEVISMNYIQEIGSFRITYENKVYDFPRNWSIFESVYDTLIKEKNSYFLLDDKTKKDFFTMIFGERKIAVIAVFSQESYIIFLKNHASIDDLEERLGL